MLARTPRRAPAASRATPLPRARPGAPPVPRPLRVTPFRALRRRDFAVYFVGNVISNCGTWFGTLAQAILVYRLTHSALLLGVLGFAQFLGTIVLAPWAGGAADRFDRRRLLALTQLVAAA